jgi:hypothetical protein
MYVPNPNTPHFYSRVIGTAGFIANGIRLVSHAPFATHVDLITPEGTYIGAHAHDGVQERPADYCKPIWERRYAIPCLKTQAIGIVQDARARIGEKYDVGDIAGLAIQHDLHTIGRTQCAEFVFDIAFKRGVMMLNVLPERDFLITPEMYHLSPLLIGYCYYEKLTA